MVMMVVMSRCWSVLVDRRLSRVQRGLSSVAGRHRVIAATFRAHSTSSEREGSGAMYVSKLYPGAGASESHSRCFSLTFKQTRIYTLNATEEVQDRRDVSRASWLPLTDPDLTGM